MQTNLLTFNQQIAIVTPSNALLEKVAVTELLRHVLLPTHTN